MTEQEAADIQGRSNHAPDTRSPPEPESSTHPATSPNPATTTQPAPSPTVSHHHPEATLTRWLFSFLDLISELAHLENPHANSTPSNNTQ